MQRWGVMMLVSGRSQFRQILSGVGGWIAWACGRRGAGGGEVAGAAPSGGRVEAVDEGAAAGGERKRVSRGEKHRWPVSPLLSWRWRVVRVGGRRPHATALRRDATRTRTVVVPGPFVQRVCANEFLRVARGPSGALSPRSRDRWVFTPPPRGRLPPQTRRWRPPPSCSSLSTRRTSANSCAESCGDTRRMSCLCSSSKAVAEFVALCAALADVLDENLICTFREDGGTPSTRTIPYGLGCLPRRRTRATQGNAMVWLGVGNAWRTAWRPLKPKWLCTLDYVAL